MPERDPFTDRCTDCGYALATLAPQDDCPECGRPVASSMPGARAGSWWQRGRWGAGVLEPLRRPRSMWDHVRPEGVGRSFGLLLVSCVLASVPMGLSLVLESGPYAAHAWYGVSFALVMAGVLVCLCLTEACGFAFISWRRGWARTPGHLMAIVGHAAPGWIVSGVLGGITWQVLARSPGVWNVRPLLVSGQPVMPEGWPVWVIMASALGVGLLCYESLAYLGMTRLRYTRTA